MDNSLHVGWTGKSKFEGPGDIPWNQACVPPDRDVYKVRVRVHSIIFKGILCGLLKEEKETHVAVTILLSSWVACMITTASMPYTCLWGWTIVSTMAKRFKIPPES